MADFLGVLKGTRVKGLTDTDPEYLKVIDPGDNRKPEGTPWYIPVYLFESIEPLSEESTDE